MILSCKPVLTTAWIITIVLATIVLILLLSSCATAHYTIADSTDSVAVSDADRVHLERVVQTFQVLDSVFIHDSIFIGYKPSERPRVSLSTPSKKEPSVNIFVDTIQIEKWHTKYKYRDRVVHDTLCKTDTVVQTKTQTITKTRTITQPPERYIPRFYKWCTGILITLILLVLAYAAFRIMKAIYLRR